MVIAMAMLSTALQSWLDKTKDLPGKAATETPDEKPKRRKKPAKAVPEEPEPAGISFPSKLCIQTVLPQLP